MAKGFYVGVGGVARKAKPYVGIGGAARKVTKAYVGVGGTPRIVYNAEISYMGTLTGLQKARAGIQAGANANYAVFMGGVYGGLQTQVDCYNSTLTRSTAADLTECTSESYGGNIGVYAWYATAKTQGTYVGSLDAYNTSLVKSSQPFNGFNGLSDPTDIDTIFYSYISMGNSSSTSYYGRTLSPSLVVGNLMSISQTQMGGRGVMMASDGRSYVVAAGGSNAALSYFRTNAVAWNASNATAYGAISGLVIGRAFGIGCGNSRLSILGGGSVFNGYDGSVLSNLVDAYDINLVHYSSTLPYSGGSPYSTGTVSTPDKAYIFYGGAYVSYDKALVRSNFTPASISRYGGSATTFQEDKILYAGGFSSSPTTYYNNVDLYQY